MPCKVVLFWVQAWVYWEIAHDLAKQHKLWNLLTQALEGVCKHAYWLDEWQCTLAQQWDHPQWPPCRKVNLMMYTLPFVVQALCLPVSIQITNRFSAQGWCENANRLAGLHEDIYVQAKALAALGVISEGSRQACGTIAAPGSMSGSEGNHGSQSLAQWFE